MRVLMPPWTGWPVETDPSAVSIGVFDGVHRGHRALIDRLIETGHTPAVLTFEPHPAEVLAPGTHPLLLSTLDERLRLFEGAGVELVGVLDLSEIRHLQPREFVSGVLTGKLAMAEIVVGVDFHFGRDRSGDVAFLRGEGDVEGFKVDVVDLVTQDDGPISSSRIRDLVQHGEIGEANRLLGSRYRLSNVVVPGDRRGRQIGFPTANLAPPERKVIPGTGVYTAFASLRGRRLEAAVNVGVRPTFGGGDLVVEAYLLDFDEDCYGEELGLEFVSRLRPEVRFEGVEPLVEQMHLDVAATREILRREAAE
jgi:riboflavin kinase / FMN adenylyltransferase